MVGEEQRGERYVGNAVPRVDAQKNKGLYETLSKAIEEGVVASAQSVHRGGLAVALAKTAMGGMLGMDISLENLPGTASRDDFKLYSESQGRVVVTVAPEYRDRFEEIMGDQTFSHLGQVTDNGSFTIRGTGSREIVNTSINELLGSYKATLGEY